MRALPIKVFYIGTIPNSYEPDKPAIEQIVIIFELDATDSQNRPHRLSKALTYSTHDKATLTKWFKPILGDKWPKVGECLDPELILGVPCMINVVHYTKINGEIGAKINTVSKLAKGMTPLESDSNQTILAFNDPEWAESKEVPQWVKDAAKGNIETTGEPKNPVEKGVPPKSTYYQPRAETPAAPLVKAGFEVEQIDEDIPY